MFSPSWPFLGLLGVKLLVIAELTIFGSSRHLSALAIMGSSVRGGDSSYGSRPLGIAGLVDRFSLPEWHIPKVVKQRPLPSAPLLGKRVNERLGFAGVCCE